MSPSCLIISTQAWKGQGPLKPLRSLWSCRTRELLSPKTMGPEPTGDQSAGKVKILSEGCRQGITCTSGLTLLHGGCRQGDKTHKIQTMEGLGAAVGCSDTTVTCAINGLDDARSGRGPANRQENQRKVTGRVVPSPHKELEHKGTPLPPSRS